MDLNPINVLADNKAAPSSANASPAKHSFADVLSAQPQSVDHRPPADPKTTQSQSNQENKQAARKDKSGEEQNPNQNQIAVDSTAVANPTLPIPTPPLVPSLFAFHPSVAIDSVKAEQDSSATPDSTAVPSTKPALLARLAVSESVSETATKRPVPEDNAQHVEAPATAVAHIAVNALQLEPPATENLLGPEARPAKQAGKPDTAKDSASANTEQNGIKQPALLTLPPVVAAAPTGPVKHESGASASASTNEPATNASAAPPSANSDPSLSALTSAAEKVGALVSATVQSTTAKAPAARPAVSALKAAIAPARVAASTLPQVSETGATRSGESDRRHTGSEKRDSTPALFDQNAATDSKAVVDETPKEPIAATPATGKDVAGASTTLSTAPSQAAAPQPKNAAPSWQGGSNVADGQGHQDAAAIALNRANLVTGMELSGLSKTSLIERFHQSELHFGMQSGEFGHIEVRTLLDHHEVTARISVEHGDLSRALESELPGLQKKLSDLDVPTARITLHEQSAAMSGESGRRSRGQEWPAWQPAQASNVDSHNTVPALIEPAISTEGLSIRI